MVEENKKASYPATVIKVIDDYTIVINRGSEHGVTKGKKFLVYTVEEEELKDPDTGESLGKLEIIRGTGTAIHVQPKITTVESNNIVSKKRVIKRSIPSFGFLRPNTSESETIEEPEKEIIPFDEAQIKDLVKPV